jgi:hypothetical protein
VSLADSVLEIARSGGDSMAISSKTVFVSMNYKIVTRGRNRVFQRLR